MFTHTFIAVLTLSLVALPCVAEDKVVERQPVQHRVTGLFSPDRENDLREVLKTLLDVKLVSVDYKTSEATFLYDADKLLSRPKPEEIPERLDNLLRSASQSTFGIRPLCLIPKDKLKWIEIPVAGLDCKACCLAAYESVYKIDGVEQATASFKDGLVTAFVNPEKTNRAALEAALKARGVTLKLEQ